jgi:hypothetical protein
MTVKPAIDWDDAFANMAYIPNADALPDRWAANAAAYRASGVRLDEHSYGDHPRERFDMIWPDGPVKGLAVFVHGGFWIRMDKSYWTDLAEGARANGWAVCMVQYTLAPEARIAHITSQVGRAINMAAGLVEGPIRIAGHSAGGHLVSRMVCEDTPLDAAVSDRLQHTLSISGLHDLRPLMHTEMNLEQQIDEAEARLESAVLRRPHPKANITAWVGGGERPEFIRQAQLLSMMWNGLDVVTKVVVDGEYDHFSVLEDLKLADSPITQAFVG